MKFRINVRIRLALEGKGRARELHFRLLLYEVNFSNPVRSVKARWL